MNDPTAPISGEDAAKIRTAAREAVKSMPGARDLGEGDIDMIVARIGGQNASLGDREAMAGGMARTIVEAQTNKPINFEAASREQIATYKAALGLPFGGKEQQGWLGKNGSDNGSSGGEQASGTSRVSSDTYGRSLTNSAVVRALTGEGYKPSEIAGVVAFTKILGVDANRYAGYFVGASQDTRDAIADHVKKGTAVTDEKLHKSEDVAAVMGAIKAGKMKPEEAPKSVQKIMKDMKESGIDPATAAPTAIHGYFKKHPKALDEAKKTVAKSEATQKTMSDDEKLKQISSVAPGKPTKNEITKPNASPTQKTVKLGL